MSRAVVLDTGPLSLLCSSNPNVQSLDCLAWFQRLLARGDRVFVPEVADYEVRRELLRAGKTASVRQLDLLISSQAFLRIETPIMRRAAQLWADARRRGKPTASPDALDGDVILAAQALSLNDPNVVVATSNVGQLGLFVAAAEWRSIA